MESKTAKNDRQTRTRSRQGCANCRRSKVKCDERKPICTRCWEKDLQCLKDGIKLKWEADFYNRGIAFGRSGVWSKTPSQSTGQARLRSNGGPRALPAGTTWLETPEIHPWNFLSNDFSLVQRLYNEDQNDIQPHLLPARERDTRAYAQRPDAPSSPLSFMLPFSDRFLQAAGFENRDIQPCLPLFPSLNELGNPILFDYYINQICPRTAPSAVSKSPFASVILPYCLSATPTVLRAIQAVAACHWSQYDSKYSRLGLQLKSKVLTELRRQITTDPQSLVAQDPEILVIVMLLCLFEIVDHCDWQWILHLQGAKDIIRLRKKQHKISPDPSVRRQEDPVSAFVELFFAFQDVMGRTACAKADLFGASYWDENDKFIDGWMGCSPALVSILFAIMDLSRSRRLMVSDSDKMTFNIKASSLNTKLQDLVQQVHTNAADQTLQSIADLKKLTCHVYLHCALYDGKPADPMIKSHVREILQGIVTLIERDSVSHVIWPLFVAAVELDPLDHELWSDPETSTVTDGRVLVLSLLDKISKVSVSSVSRTRSVIEQVWQTRDFKASGSSRPPSDLNDWEHYVVPVSDALSLV
ncbi:uncharacterized protein N7496_003206 [Penicillium cataractarum]|uniref:Zn(2)-C6 fungal-type domain-containing protein n=1 Tax=Penicillium cataractarum TaxID=2100454 RepID=A0A9W9SLI9_9EURO|nr:uncharacterized protein N7496_003206 [Penicillium cataractarum]KAJ5380778.1 hypothetical protein N7496_003206 [Penicillium cataractarum]